MTNNPTIDGVSRERIAFIRSEVECGAPIDANSARDLLKVIDHQNEMALKIAPAVERQPSAFLYETAMKCTENSEGRVYSGFLPSLGVSLPSVPEDSLRNIRPLYEVAPEVTALQSTIARLEARVAELESEEPEWSVMQQRLGDENEQLRTRIAELESGRGEPVAEVQHGAFDDVGAPQWVRVVTLGDYDLEHIPDGTKLFTAPPAPVGHTMKSVMSAVCAITGFPILTSNQCHALAQSLNACIVATAALNGPAK